MKKTLLTACVAIILAASSRTISGKCPDSDVFEETWVLSPGMINFEFY